MERRGERKQRDNAESFAGGFFASEALKIGLIAVVKAKIGGEEKNQNDNYFKLLDYNYRYKRAETSRFDSNLDILLNVKFLFR